MKCAIMQPTFLPWAGYFNLIKSVDSFVFLDDVQFDRRSWQSRNRVFDNGKIAWLTCPTVKAPQSALISDIRIDNTRAWQEQHSRRLHHSYHNTAFYHELDRVFTVAFGQPYEYLADLNIAIIEEILRQCEITTRVCRSSDMNVEGKRSQKLLNICKCIGATEYLSPQGSKSYLEDDDVFNTCGVTLGFQEFEPAVYTQSHTHSDKGNFISHLSIVDVVANLGWEQFKKYIRDDYVNREVERFKATSDSVV